MTNNISQELIVYKEENAIKKFIKRILIYLKRGNSSGNWRIKKKIENIKERNKRVELDKAWETSWTRKICIMILTNIVVIIYFYVIRNIDIIF